MLRKMNLCQSHPKCVKSLEYKFHSRTNRYQHYFELKTEGRELLALIPSDPDLRRSYMILSQASPETALTAQDFMIFAICDPKTTTAAQVPYVVFSLGNGFVVARTIGAINALAPKVTIIEKPQTT